MIFFTQLINAFTFSFSRGSADLPLKKGKDKIGTVGKLNGSKKIETFSL